jgi:hypothetical protein
VRPSRRQQRRRRRRTGLRLKRKNSGLSQSPRFAMRRPVA